MNVLVLQIVHCVAFAYYLNGNCQLWLGSVLNLKNVSTDVDNSDDSNPIFYLRLAASEFVTSGKFKKPHFP